MATHDEGFAEYYGFQPSNFLLEWARRANRVDRIGDYYVEQSNTHEGGRVVFRIRDLADKARTPHSPDNEPVT